MKYGSFFKRSQSSFQVFTKNNKYQIFLQDKRREERPRVERESKVARGEEEELVRSFMSSSSMASGVSSPAQLSQGLVS